MICALHRASRWGSGGCAPAAPWCSPPGGRRPSATCGLTRVSARSPRRAHTAGSPRVHAGEPHVHPTPPRRAHTAGSPRVHAGEPHLHPMPPRRAHTAGSPRVHAGEPHLHPTSPRRRAHSWKPPRKCPGVAVADSCGTCEQTGRMNRGARQSRTDDPRPPRRWPWPARAGRRRTIHRSELGARCARPQPPCATHCKTGFTRFTGCSVNEYPRSQ